MKSLLRKAYHLFVTQYLTLSDLLHIYNLKREGIGKSTGLNFVTLFPNNFEKQKVSLALNIFNEKTVAALRQEKREETGRLIELVVCMWKMLNIKSRKAGNTHSERLL